MDKETAGKKSKYFYSINVYNLIHGLKTESTSREHVTLMLKEKIGSSTVIKAMECEFNMLVQHHPTCCMKNVGCVCGPCWMMLDQQFIRKKCWMKV